MSHFVCALTVVAENAASAASNATKRNMGILLLSRARAMVSAMHRRCQLIRRLGSDAKLGGKRVGRQAFAARKRRRHASERFGSLRRDRDDAAALLKVVDAE